MSLAELLQDRQFWLDFLNDYENMPVLWKTSHPHFTSKKYRDQALHSLTKKVRQRWSGANVEFVKQRISNFRRTFLNEYEKVKRIQQTNNTTYVPSLYYYNHLKFLKEHDNEATEILEQPKCLPPKIASSQKMMFCNDFLREKQLSSQTIDRSSIKAEHSYDEIKPPKRMKLLPISSEVVSNIVLENENYDIPAASEDEATESSVNEQNEDAENEFSIVEVIPESLSPPSPPPAARPSPSSCEFKESEDVLRPTKEEFDDIARRIASHFSKMDAEQCLLAEKLIFDICISGRLKRLSARTTITDA